MGCPHSCGSRIFSRLLHSDIRAMNIDIVGRSMTDGQGLVREWEKRLLELTLGADVV